jgi:L-arabinonolactonase
MKAELVTDCRDWHGEGIFWSAEHGLLFWTDIFGQRVSTYDPARRELQSYKVPGRVCAFASRKERPWNEVVAAFADGFAFLDLATGEHEYIARLETEKPGVRMNDGRTDRQGRFIVGGMEEESERPVASVFRLDPDLTVQRLFDGVGCANGTCFSPDGQTMWFADSSRRAIEAFDYNIATGVPSNRRIVARTKGIPDGSCVDSEGYVWNAVWKGGRVDRYAPDGRLEQSIEVPVNKVTCVAFGGADLDTLFMTTSRFGESEADLATQPTAGSLYAVKPGVRGLADAPFAG